jgi:hypothetical protein
MATSAKYRVCIVFITLLQASYKEFIAAFCISAKNQKPCVADDARREAGFQKRNRAPVHYDYGLAAAAGAAAGAPPLSLGVER